MADMVQVRRGRSHQFRDGPDVRVGRSQFDRSHGHKTTFDASELIPILVDEVLPGDTFTCKLHGFCRVFSPLDFPIMDNIELETSFWFVPCRLVWDNWPYFQGEHNAAGAQDTDYTIPVLSSGTFLPGSVGAYFGLPQQLDASSVEVNALPFRAYRLIYNEWFRDQNLITEGVLSHGNGPDTPPSIHKSAKKHDYFTSCLPYLQKGDPVTIPVSGQAPVTAATYASDLGIDIASNGSRYKVLASGTYAQASNSVTGGTALYAELADVAQVEINQLREAVAIQRLLELDARSGTRYTEAIKARFGVTVPDYRLQRPEYLGGGKSYINVSPVANTSATASEDQGQLTGVAAGAINGHGWAKSFVEHGYIIGLIRARGDISYFQGLDRMWSRSSRYDFYEPLLANLGEQAVLNKEIFVSNDSNDDGVFGYQERWAEYRSKRSLITGKLSPEASGALSYTHLAEDFSSLPSLNQTFIEDHTPMSRVTTVDGEPDFILDMWFDYKCARPLPVFSIPSLMSARF
jgi:hypothetical protein